MKTNVHLRSTGSCDAEIAFYETAFHTKRLMTMKWVTLLQKLRVRKEPKIWSCTKPCSWKISH